MPKIVDKNNFEKQVQQSNLPVVIDVFAEWCGPCQQMAPIFEELEKEHGDAYKFVKLNVDQSRELAIQFGVSSIPTFVFLKDGDVKGKETGYMSKEDLLEKIKGHLG